MKKILGIGLLISCLMLSVSFGEELLSDGEWNEEFYCEGCTIPLDDPDYIDPIDEFFKNWIIQTELEWYDNYYIEKKKGKVYLFW